MGKKHEQAKHKIIILCGQSACGKNTIEEKLVNNHFERIVTNTTRPPREGEIDGKDYNFITEFDFFSLIAQNKMIEWRKYKTEFGVWYYGASSQNIDLTKHDYVVILTLDGAKAFIEYFGRENCIVFYIDCPKSIREKRAKSRDPKGFNQEEWDRRAKADKADFANDKVFKICDFKIANYERRLHDVIQEILKDIRIWKNG
jgi:guanylate kinase